MLRIAASHYRLPRALPAVASGDCLRRCLWLPRAVASGAVCGCLCRLPVGAACGCLCRLPVGGRNTIKKALIAESLINYIKNLPIKQ